MNIIKCSRVHIKHSCGQLAIYYAKDDKQWQSRFFLKTGSPLNYTVPNECFTVSNIISDSIAMNLSSEIIAVTEEMFFFRASAGRRL